MGDPSSFSDEDLTTIDKSGLKAFMERWEKEFPGYFWAKNMIDEKGNATFQSWDDIKLISYWYSQQCLFLRCIARYIRGEVRWQFCSEDEAGWVEFTNGKAIIHTGQMQWQDSTPESLIEIEYRKKDEKEYKKIKEFMIQEAI